MYNYVPNLPTCIQAKHKRRLWSFCVWKLNENKKIFLESHFQLCVVVDDKILSKDALYDFYKSSIGFIIDYLTLT